MLTNASSNNTSVKNTVKSSRMAHRKTHDNINFISIFIALQKM